MLDAAFVVRGGTLDVDRVCRRARLDSQHPRMTGRLGISAAVAIRGETVDELISVSGIRHGKLQRSSAGRIRAAGCTVYRTGAYPHCTIDLGAEPIEDAAIRLLDAFDRPERNPGAHR